MPILCPTRALSSVRLALLLATAGWLSAEHAIAQGPSSRGAFSGPTVTRTYRSRDSGEVLTYQTESKVPIPDLFRMEAPLVERNFRTDYVFTNHLHEPLADESQFFGELDYSFTEQFGIFVASPLLNRNHFDGSEASGFGDLETGARYVAIGSDPNADFKLAFGFTVTSPTGDVEDELGEGETFLEPQILTQRKLAHNTFVQTQFGAEVPTSSGETTEFGYNIGMGRVYETSPQAILFRYPTPTLEFNGSTGIGGEEAGVSILDITPGLRWMIGGKTFAGVAASMPLTGEREFETQFIFSVIHQYGGEDADDGAAGAPSSRAAF